MSSAKCRPRTAFSQNFDDLLSNPLPRNLSQRWCELLHGGKRLRSNGKAQPGGKADGSNHSQVIFLKACRRVSNGTNDTIVEICLPTNIINDGVRQRVKEHAIDREIASQRVLSGIAETNGHRVTAIEIVAICPKRRHLIGNTLQDNEDKPRTAHQPGCVRE